MTTALITLGCTLGSIAVATIASIPLGVPLRPTLSLAIVTPLLVATPFTYLLLRLLQESQHARHLSDEREAQYRNLYHRTPALLHSVDENGYLVSVSDYWLSRLGYERDEVIGRQYFEFLTDSSRHYSQTVTFPAFLAAGHVRDASLHWKTKSGEIVETVLSAVEETDQDGKFVKSITVLTEVTELHRAQDALRESETKFRSVIERAGDAFFLHDPHGNFIEVNDAACRTLGYRRDELIGMNVADVECEIGMTELEKYWKRMVQGEPITLPGRQRRKDGSEFPVEVRLGAIQLGDQHHILALARDITRRIEAEESRRQHEADLAHLLRNQTMSEMAGWLAHEINQPLAAIAAYVRGSMLRLKRSDTADEAILDALDKAHQQSLHAGQIIQRLRGFVSATNERDAVSDFRTAVREAVTMIEHLAAVKNIEIEQDLPRDACIVIGDPIHLQQVIMNLLRNAIDAIDSRPEGRRHIKLSLTADDNHFTLRLEDTGPGVPDSVRTALFDRFISSKPDGMGMGLAICRSILDDMDGRINLVESTENGTCFSVSLPRQMVDDSVEIEPVDLKSG